MRAKTQKTSSDVGQPLDLETFGRRLRRARKLMGWTLAELSRRSGVSMPTISRAERGQLALGYQNFAALSQALRMDMNAMLSDDGVQVNALDAPIVTRAGEGVVYAGSSIAYEFLCSTATGKLMSPVVGTVNAREVPRLEEFTRHDGEEFAMVISGMLEIHFESGQVVRLEQGDSVYFDSRLGHAYVSTSRQAARIVGCVARQNELFAR